MDEEVCVCAGALGIYVVLYISAGGNSKEKWLSEIEHMSERTSARVQTCARQTTKTRAKVNNDQMYTALNTTDNNNNSNKINSNAYTTNINIVGSESSFVVLTTGVITINLLVIFS